MHTEKALRKYYLFDIQFIMIFQLMTGKFILVKIYNKII